MAGYFSNHSNQSRFLANSSQSTTTTTQSPTPATSNSHPAGAPRNRVASSKHFSTSLTTSVDERVNSQSSKSPASANGTGEVHPLRNTWVFWFRQQRTPGNKIISYEEGIKKISACSSVESFWSLWTHLSPPSTLVPTTDYLIFHAGVRRPVWEDPLNLGGGKWIIRLKKGVADRIWEELVLGIIGDQFDECKIERDSGQGKVDNGTNAGLDGAAEGTEISSGDWPEICGATLSVRQSEDILSVWNKTDGDMKLREKIRDTIRQVLHLSPSTIMEYKSNNDSMQDKSSFRNSAIDRTPLS